MRVANIVMKTLSDSYGEDVWLKDIKLKMCINLVLKYYVSRSQINRIEQ